MERLNYWELVHITNVTGFFIGYKGITWRSLFRNRCTSGYYHVTWTSPYHVIVPAMEMTGKVVRKITINHKCSRLFHFCSNDMCFSSALSPCVEETRTYSRFMENPNYLDRYHMLIQKVLSDGVQH